MQQAFKIVPGCMPRNHNLVPFERLVLRVYSFSEKRGGFECSMRPLGGAWPTTKVGVTFACNTLVSDNWQQGKRGVEAVAVNDMQLGVKPGWPLSRDWGCQDAGWHEVGGLGRVTIRGPSQHGSFARKAANLSPWPREHSAAGAKWFKWLCPDLSQNF